MDKEEILNTFLLANIPEIITQEEFDDVKKAIKDLQQENQELKNDINKLQKELNEENLQCSKYSIEFNNLKEKNKQLKGNWNKIKEYFNERIEVCDNRLSSPFCNVEKATKRIYLIFRKNNRRTRM